MNNTANKDPFYRPDGSLTAYSFACGYVMKKENSKQWKDFYMEHNHYHVRTGPIEEGQHRQFITWETFDSSELTKARKFYNSIKL